MKQVIEIDEAKKIITNLSLSALEILLPIVKDSIKKLKADEKKKSKGGGLLLFTDPADEETIFSNSVVNNIFAFRKQLAEAEKLGVDVDYYYNSVKDWSETKPKIKRTARGWISTAHQFMRADNDKKRLKMIQSENQQKIEEKEMRDYLNI